jgi:hypothetical protein
MVAGELVLQRKRDERLLDGQDEDLVVGQQPAVDRGAEAQAVKLRAVDVLVVHRGELRRMLIGLVLDASSKIRGVAVMYSRRAA